MLQPCHCCRILVVIQVNGIIIFGSVVSEELLSLSEYYSSVLSKTGLVKKECEFRTNKLSLVLDFIRAIGIPEKLEKDLTSAIIDSWRLQVPERTLLEREIELKKIIGCINGIKTVVNWMEKSTAPLSLLQFNFRVLSNLPISSFDLKSEDIPRIHDLIAQAMGYCISIAENRLSPWPDARS